MTITDRYRKKTDRLSGMQLLKFVGEVISFISSADTAGRKQTNP